MIKIDIDEFDRLVNASMQPGPDDFARILESLVTMTDAKAGALWKCDQTPFAFIAHHAVGEAARLSFSQNDHDRILAQVAGQQHSAVVKTKSADGQDAPTVFFAPLKGDTKRVLELVFPAAHDQIGSREFLQKLNQLCGVIEKLQPAADRAASIPTPAIGSADLAAQSKKLDGHANSISLPAFSRFVHTLNSSIDKRLTCANIANEVRALLDCDRVSVVLHHRGRFRIVSISGQPSVNRRSNTVQLLEKLASEVFKAKSELWYPNDEEVVPQIKTILDQYLVVSTTRSLYMAPIHENDTAGSEDPEADLSSSDSIIGGIIYEQHREEWSRDDKLANLRLTTRHSGDALRNAQRHQELFLYPLWHWLGRARWLRRGSGLSKTALALAAIVATCLLLTFWQTSFYVSAAGTLVPQHRQLVFAKIAGEVVQVPVEHGQWIKQGQTLVVLRSEDLQLRLEDVNGRMETLKQRRSAMERSKFKNASSPTAAGAAAIDENLGSLQAEIDSLQRQADALTRMQSELNVASPTDGQVITWDVAQKLSGRTVTPQNVLMEIADTKGPWQLELELEDRRIEHLLRGLKLANDGQLQVQFTLAAEPDRTYTGTLSEVSKAIQLSQDNRQMMRVKVDIDEEALKLKQAKTGVTAKIYTGETTSVGYLWLHEIPRTLNRYVFFYFTR